MAYQSQCQKIQNFIEQVSELVDAIESEDMASEYFASQIESVNDAKSTAEIELSDIEDGDEVTDVEQAAREANRVKNHLQDALRDIDDCLTELGE